MTNSSGNGQNSSRECVQIKRLSDKRNSKQDFQLVDARRLFLNEEVKKKKHRFEELKE